MGTENHRRSIIDEPLPIGGAGMAECRKAVQDGFIWPVERRRMRHPVNIRARMAEDFAALRREKGAHGVVLDLDMIALGWTRPQVEAHGRHAVNMAVRGLIERRSEAASAIACGAVPSEMQREARAK